RHLTRYWASGEQDAIVTGERKSRRDMNRPFNGVIDRSGFNFYKLNAEKFSGTGSYSKVSISLLVVEKWGAKIVAIFESFLYRFAAYDYVEIGKVTSSLAN